MDPYAHAFDADLQEANVWLKAINRRLTLDDPHAAKRALRGVLHALRDRIGPANAVHLAAQLPTVIRGLFFEGWHMAPATDERHRDEFMTRVTERSGRGSAMRPEDAVDAVLHTLWNHIDPGETAKVEALLPPEIASLWPNRPDAVDVAAYRAKGH